MLDVVKALEWVHGALQAPALVLMSLGGPATAILDAAAQSLTNTGVTVVVAGGNSAGGGPPVLSHVYHPANGFLQAMLLSSSRNQAPLRALKGLARLQFSALDWHGRFGHASVRQFCGHTQRRSVVAVDTLDLGA